MPTPQDNAKLPKYLSKKQNNFCSLDTGNTLSRNQFSHFLVECNIMCTHHHRKYSYQKHFFETFHQRRPSYSLLLLHRIFSRSQTCWQGNGQMPGSKKSIWKSCFMYNVSIFFSESFT